MKTKATARKPTKTKTQSIQASAIPLPTLKQGERWAGILLNTNSAPSHHIILLPGEADKVTWAQAKKWAKEAGGELPTRREQSLLFANLKDQFQLDWYWSCEQHAGNADGAWLQGFGNGYQGYDRKGFHCRARAVRRIKI